MSHRSWCAAKSPRQVALAGSSIDSSRGDSAAHVMIAGGHRIYGHLVHREDGLLQGEQRAGPVALRLWLDQHSRWRPAPCERGVTHRHACVRCLHSKKWLSCCFTLSLPPPLPSRYVHALQTGSGHNCHHHARAWTCTQRAGWVHELVITHDPTFGTPFGRKGVKAALRMLGKLPLCRIYLQILESSLTSSLAPSNALSAVDGILVEFELVSRILNANVQVSTQHARLSVHVRPKYCSFVTTEHFRLV
eukprot:scaffold17877_cov31-Tisochrysis_lutea.AAC.2